MAKSEIFRGSMVAIVTPFKDGSVDHEAVDALCRWHVEEGTDGIVVRGTTGESPALSDREADDLLRTVIKAVDGKVPVICGAGANVTEHAIELSKQAEATGADALLHVTPYYNKPTQGGLLAHYQAIADAVSIPICLYSVPGRTALAIAPETVAALSEHENVAALKEAGGSVDRVSEVKRLTDLDVVSGDDAITLPMIAVGAVGAISVTGNVAPRLHSEMVHAALEGDFRKGRELHERLYPLSKALFVETNPTPVKAALALMGKIRNELRLPLVPMTTANREMLAEVLRDLGVELPLTL